MPEAKFEWYKDKAGKFRFRLVAPNGQTIAVGEGYETKDALVKGIESVKKNAPIAKTMEIPEFHAWKKKPSKPLRRREGEE
jgi:hypothetical protein